MAVVAVGAFVPLVLFAISGYFPWQAATGLAGALVAMVCLGRHFGRLVEEERDTIALQATGDLSVAESAIVKSIKYGPLAIAVGDPEKDRRVQRRLGELRDRASRLAAGMRGM